MTTPLRRQLGLADAVTVGAGSMIGAGVFSAWAPAAGAAGTGLLVGLVVAAVVAFCNATSSAQLAAQHPESGGTYVYARHQLGPFWGHLAGWAFIVGKTASCVAIALTAGAYLWPEQARLVAVAAVIAVTLVNIGGLDPHRHGHQAPPRRDTVALTAVVVAGWSSPAASLARISPLDTSPPDVLRAGGFLFFAFAGYARIATLGEEVRDPATTIPKAIPRALAGVLAIYAIVGVTLLATVPVRAIAATDAPLTLVVVTSPLEQLTPIVESAPASLRSACSSTSCPASHAPSWPWPDATNCPTGSPTSTTTAHIPLRAELLVTAVIAVLTANFDLRGAIGFSGVTILTYYAITNAACLTLPPDQRRWPRPIAAVGLVGCVALAVMLPAAAIVAAAGVLLTGIVVRRIGSAADDRATSDHPTVIETIHNPRHDDPIGR